MAGPRRAPGRPERRDRSRRRLQVGQRQAELIHRQQRHGVRPRLAQSVAAHLPAHAVGEPAATGHEENRRATRQPRQVPEQRLQTSAPPPDASADLHHGLPAKAGHPRSSRSMSARQAAGAT